MSHICCLTVFLRPTYVKVSRRKKKKWIKEGLHLTLESMTRRANSGSPEVMERCFVGSSMTQMVAGKADCSHCSIVSHNSGVRLFWTSQLTSHCVIYWTGGGLFSQWMSIDSRHQLSIITAAIDLMETALGHYKTPILSGMRAMQRRFTWTHMWRTQTWK